MTTINYMKETDCSLFVGRGNEYTESGIFLYKNIYFHDARFRYPDLSISLKKYHGSDGYFVSITKLKSTFEQYDLILELMPFEHCDGKIQYCLYNIKTNDITKMMLGEDVFDNIKLH